MMQRGWPRINDIHTNMLPTLGPATFSTVWDTTDRGIYLKKRKIRFWTASEIDQVKRTCIIIPQKAHKLNIRNGTLTKYSWKKALTKKTDAEATILLKPLVTNGMYKCLETKIFYIA